MNSLPEKKESQVVKRPDWDAYFKQICLVTKSRSPCERLLVGCLLVKDNRIISQGYNVFYRCPHKSVARHNHEQAYRSCRAECYL